MELTVIIPFYNEDELNVLPMLEVLRAHNISWIVVDDGSRDKCGLSQTLRKPYNEGYGAAIKTGLVNCETKYVAIIDSDKQYDVNDILKLWYSLRSEDMLVGKRERHQGDWNRLWGRLLLKFIASLFALKYIPDLNSGLRIFRRDLAIAYQSILCDKFSYTSTLTLAMLLDGYKVEWIPCQFDERIGRKSSMRAIRSGLVTVYHLLRITIGLRTRRLRKWLKCLI